MIFWNNRIRICPNVISAGELCGHSYFRPLDDHLAHLSTLWEQKHLGLRETLLPHWQRTMVVSHQPQAFITLRTILIEMLTREDPPFVASESS